MTALLVATGTVDRVVDNYAEVELLTPENEVRYMTVPVELFPCTVAEGSLFYLYKSNGVTKMECGSPPE
jgi:hypothetical protein